MLYSCGFEGEHRTNEIKVNKVMTNIGLVLPLPKTIWLTWVHDCIMVSIPLRSTYHARTYILRLNHLGINMVYNFLDPNNNLACKDPLMDTSNIKFGLVLHF